MAERRKFAKEPLLYIHQPTVQKPAAPMQHFYTTPKKAKPTKAAVVPETEKKTIKKSRDLSTITKEIAKELKEPKVPIKKAPNPIQTETEVESSSSSNDQPQLIQDKGKKKFKDMTILEKVDYFLHTPNHLPSMRCEVKTEERKYRGVIKDFQDNTIYMQVGRRVALTKIPIDDITEIQLLGF